MSDLSNSILEENINNTNKNNTKLIVFFLLVIILLSTNIFMFFIYQKNSKESVVAGGINNDIQKVIKQELLVERDNVLKLTSEIKDADSKLEKCNDSLEKCSNEYLEEWKVLKNDKYDFSFKYPSVFSQKTNEYTLNEKNISKRVFDVVIEYSSLGDSDTSLDGLRFLNIDVYKKTMDEWLSEKVYIGKWSDHINPDPKDYKTRAETKVDNEIIFNEKRAFKFDQKSCDITGCSENANVILVLEKNEQLYIFEISWLFRDFADLFFDSLLL